jgi:hypothetical protein
MPNPTYRAVFMLSLMVAGRLLGQVQQPLYPFFSKTIFFIFLNPAVI